jgi:prevent-host-death family protein
MDVPMSKAKAQLTELVRRAEAGEEVVLTRHGKPAVKLAPVRAAFDPEERRRLNNEVIESARGKALAGPSAARAADFLYDDETGLPA